MNEHGLHEIESLRDVLTGLPGIDAARERLEEWLVQGAEDGAPACIHALLIGLRRFDAVNLAYGAAAGDGALARVAARMSHTAAEAIDGSWFVARSTGGNFLLMANETCSRERWQLFAEQLADEVSQPIAVPAGVLRLSPRVALLRGLADEGVDSILDRLGQALAGLKGSQQRLAWADGEATRPGRSAAQLEADLLGAIDRDEIEILFQPQFSLPDDRLSGAEALARWNHPTLGRIGAGALFAIAERSDHVAPLSQHIARRALHQARDWPDGLRLSLNVTPADLAALRFVGELFAIVRESGFPAHRLTLEVTEQALLHDIHLAARMLEEIAGQGIRIALDDFGAGFCNFRYLKVLPLHYLKLDRSMIDGITSDERDLAVLRAIIAMAGALDLQVIAEGIENEAQRAIIASEHCAFYQGFLRARPMSGADLLDYAGNRA
ncbi:MAG: GGDEF domain-containing protein [Novosphingobium sp.]|nr:GGDEF domain-containing protein [Novosphingobium sp.]